MRNHLSLGQRRKVSLSQPGDLSMSNSTGPERIQDHLGRAAPACAHTALQLGCDPLLLLHLFGEMHAQAQLGLRATGVVDELLF